MSEVAQLPRPIQASGTTSPQLPEPEIQAETLELLEWPRLAAHVAPVRQYRRGSAPVPAAAPGPIAGR